jgi:hypothetical protein
MLTVFSIGLMIIVVFLMTVRSGNVYPVRLCGIWDDEVGCQNGIYLRIAKTGTIKRNWCLGRQQATS